MPSAPIAALEKPIHILHLEDNPRDAELIREMLENGGISCKITRVASRQGFIGALEKSGFDLVIANFTFPSFDGAQALAVSREKCPDAPFVFISGAVGEEFAVQALVAGATDYILKRNLKRLVPAVERALLESEQRSERKRTEEMLRLQGAALEAAANAVMITDRGGRILWTNPAFTRTTGYALEEILGQTPRILKSGRYDEEFYRRIWRTILSGQVWRGEIINRKKDGSSLPEEMTITPVRDQKGEITHFVAIKQDITERQEAEDKLKQAEQQLRQAQKMEAVGRLAGGVAHDFNNLLTAILGYCNFLETSLGDGDPRLQDLMEIAAGANRAAGLTRQLLAFSRKQVLAPRILDLNSVVENMEKMLRRLIGEDIDLALALERGLKRVKMDAGQLEQVLMNLVVNSRDAMPLGGKLTIETMNVAMDEESPGRHDVVPVGSYAMMAVSDTGCGMDEKTKAHLFEPFLTTKSLGRGTGLGLSTVYGIVKQSNGYIWVYSELDKGTTFKIYFPATEEAAEPLVRESRNIRNLNGSETILLVEDDDSVRNLLRRVLRQNGYAVIEAKTGVEAAAAFERRAKEIDLVVTDVVMPEMGGRLLVERLRSARPGIKVIYISGYTDDAVIRHGELGAGVVFLQKPLTPNIFLAKVRNILDGLSNRE